MEYRFNETLLSIPPSASVAISDKARRMKEEGIDIISLAAGEPDFDTPAKAAMTGIAGIADGHTHYAATKGILPLRERIARKLREENGIDCDAENILMAPGGKYAIYESLFTLLTPGKREEVMILQPSWVSYGPMVTACGGVPVGVELSFEDNYRISREILDQYVSENTRVLILNYPNNPTGCVLSKEEAEIVADFALDHDLMLIADEIYEKITYADSGTASLAAIGRIKDRVITINGFSKSSAMTGWRLGYICAPHEIINKTMILHQHTISCVSQFAMEAALVSMDCEDDVAAMIKSYRHRRDFFVDGLNAIDGVTCHMPQGAFYAWAKVDAPDMNSFEIADYLLDEAKVAVVPGDAYGLGGAGCIRMSYATAEADLREALTRMKAAIDKLRASK